MEINLWVKILLELYAIDYLNLTRSSKSVSRSLNSLFDQHKHYMELGVRHFLTRRYLPRITNRKWPEEHISREWFYLTLGCSEENIKEAVKRTPKELRTEVLLVKDSFDKSLLKERLGSENSYSPM